MFTITQRAGITLRAGASVTIVYMHIGRANIHHILAGLWLYLSLKVYHQTYLTWYPVIVHWIYNTYTYL